MPFDRDYDADDLLDLLREHGVLTTHELADRMGADYSTTYRRLRKLRDEGLVSAWEYGSGQHLELVWYALAE